MHSLTGSRFARMNGCGNEIVVLDLRGTGTQATAGDARAIGAAPRMRFDQLMVIRDSRRDDTVAFIDIFNIDGSTAEACGNGMRCVAWWLGRDLAPGRLEVETVAGRLSCERHGEFDFSIDMGEPRFGWGDIPLSHPVADTGALDLSFSPRRGSPLNRPSGLSMGNPHAVFFVADASAHDLAEIGPPLEHHPLFPERANVSIAEVRGDDILLRVWERGAGATRACGSAACATLVAAARRGLCGRAARLRLPGGTLSISWGGDNRVMMRGPVEFEFEGRLTAAILDGRAA